MRLSSQRQSLSSSQNAPNNSVLQNVLRTSVNSSNRALASQPASYDIITNQPFEPERSRKRSLSQSRRQEHPLRKSLNRTSIPPQEKPIPTVSQQKYQEDTLTLQARINKLEYELRNLDGERGLLTLQHEKELRDAQARADADFRKYQEAEAERLKALQMHESVVKEVRDIRDKGVNDNAAVERRARDLQNQCNSLREEKEELEGRLSDSERELRRVKVEEVESARARLERTMQETTSELEEMKSRFDNINSKLQEREHYAEEMEKKVLELNNTSGGGAELEVLRKEFLDQMENLRKLETLEREQRTKIRRLEDEKRNVNVVLEEKKSLELEIQVLKEAERRAHEMELQKEILEDERRTWTSLLEKDGEDQQEFDSPEAVVRTLVKERIEHAILLERLGTAESEAVGKDEAIRALQSERSVFKEELENHEQAQAASAEEASNALARMETNYQLAKKQVEYLQAQLETFTAEQAMNEENFNTQQAAQIKQLESLVSEHKTEIEKLNGQLAAAVEPRAPSTPMTGQKRKAEDPDSEQIGQLVRKNKNLQIALQKTTEQSKLLATELQASRSQLKALRSSSRILELKDNPTARHEAVKMETLRVLKQENSELMSQLRGDESMSRVRVVPASSLDAVKLELQDKDTVIADREKRMRRQKEIWTQKAIEFREAVASILGYQMIFLPNGKVRVRNMYYNPPRDNESDEDIPDDDREDYIEFDSEKGTMKIGRDDAFEQDVSESVSYWIREKKEIPCFLAAMTLEFYEKYGGMVQKD